MVARSDHTRGEPVYSAAVSVATSQYTETSQTLKFQVHCSKADSYFDSQPSPHPIPIWDGGQTVVLMTFKMQLMQLNGSQRILADRLLLSC